MGDTMEAAFRALFESAPYRQLVLEPDAPRFTIVAVTDSYVRATKQERAELVGRGVFEISPGPGLVDLGQSLEAVLRTRAPHVMPAQKHGERWWSAVNAPVLASNGELAYLVHTIEDATELVRLRHAEEALRFAEATSSGILDISPDAIISIDDHQRITLFNRGAEVIFGHSKAEAIGAPLELLIPARFRAIHRRHVERFAAGPTTATRMGERGAAIFGLRKNGQEFSADAAISRLEVDGKRILTVALRDVTAERRAEHELRFLSEAGAILASTLDYEQTLTSVAHLAVHEVAQLCIVDVFEECDELRWVRAVSRDPSLEWACEIISRVQPVRTPKHPMWAALETRRSVLMEDMSPETIESFAQDPELRRAVRAVDPKSAVVVPLLAQDKLLGAIAFVSSTPNQYTHEDVPFAEALAHRAALAIENARLYQAAHRAIQARDDVLGIIAHDLRNPLNAVLMRSDLMRRRGREPERRSQDAADAIRRSVLRMDRLIQDLLDITRIEARRLSVQPAPVAAGPVLAESIEVQQPLAASAAVELRLEVRGELPDLWAERDRLLQIFENLIGNAVKFTPQGGTIVVGALARAGEVLFWVADTGPGVSQEDLPHLFDRFWQARPTGRRGAGLGLPIVRGLVEAHGGHVWVESTVGRGSTFFFTIPTAPRPDEALTAISSA